MPTYAAALDLQERLGDATALRLTTDSGTSVNATKLTQALDRAEGTINSYLRERYDTPIAISGDQSDLSAWLFNLTLDMAEWHVYQLRPPAAMVHKDKYDAAIKELDLIADGKKRLASNNAIASPTPDTLDGDLCSITRVASRDNMKEVISWLTEQR